jgi:glucose-1-phosphate thymidylyltransferase
VYAYEVRDPERYGVIEFDANGKAISLERKTPAAKIELCSSGHLFL